MKYLVAVLALGGANAFSGRHFSTPRRHTSGLRLRSTIDEAPATVPEPESATTETPVTPEETVAVEEPVEEAGDEETILEAAETGEVAEVDGATVDSISPVGDVAISKWRPRARAKWDKDLNCGKYANDEVSVAYKYLTTQTPLGDSPLAPLIEKCKARPTLLDGTHAGDYGFDPMNYASSEELLFFYLESEVKHGRLAMLGAAGWIAAELASGERAPAILNGNFFEFQNVAAVALLFGAWSYIEHQVYPAQYIEHTPNNGRYNYQHFMDGPYVAGNLEFDPLNLYNGLTKLARGGSAPEDAVGRKAMRELEVAHGRFAMMGLTFWVLWEAATGVPITSMSAIFFKPFWRWGLPGLGENGLVGGLEFATLLAGAGFLAYQNVMEIDSMKYQGDGDPDFSFMPDGKE